MKNNLLRTFILLLVGLNMVVLTSCSSDDDPADLQLNLLTADNIDLNGATSPNDVAINPVIRAEFSTSLQAASVSSSTVKLIQEYDNSEVDVTIQVSDKTVTITPTSALGTGTLYELQFLTGIMSDEDQPLGVLSRTFTTAGTFAPAGVIAHWTFENSANDVVGGFNPTANGVVDITYEASRNANAGMAATFNGTSSIIEIPNGDVLIDTDDLTISFWVKANSNGHVDANGNPKGHFVMGLGAFYGFQYEIFGAYNGAKFAFRYELADGETSGEDMWMPADATDASTGGFQGWDYAKVISEENMIAMIKDNWLHVTYTYDAASKQANLYYNGERVKGFNFNLWPDGDAKQTVVGHTYAGAEPDVVNELAFGFIQSRAGTMWDAEAWGGYDFPGANHFGGQLDDVKFYHKALTATEIQLMYNSEQ